MHWGFAGMTSGFILNDVTITVNPGGAPIFRGAGMYNFMVLVTQRGACIYSHRDNC